MRSFLDLWSRRPNIYWELFRADGRAAVARRLEPPPDCERERSSKGEGDWAKHP